MKRIAFALLLLGACGLEHPPEVPSCCHYICNGPRAATFSTYYGSEAECEAIATERCAMVPGAQGVGVWELERVDLEDGEELDCAARFVAFRTHTSTVVE